jgi:hypothetical protein
MSSWVMPSWMEKYVEFIIDEIPPNCSIEQAMSPCVGSPTLSQIRSSVELLQRLHDSGNLK